MSSHRRVPRPSICSHRMRDLTGRRKTMNSSAGISTPVESRGIELALVFNIVERFNAGLCVDLPDLFAFFEKDSFDPHVGVDRHWVVVHEPAVEDRLLDAIAENRFPE